MTLHFFGLKVTKQHLKSIVASTTALRYYDPHLPVTLQGMTRQGMSCDHGVTRHTLSAIVNSECRPISTNGSNYLVLVDHYNDTLSSNLCDPTRKALNGLLRALAQA